jgi:beta-fructofuranosidase
MPPYAPLQSKVEADTDYCTWKPFDYNLVYKSKYVHDEAKKRCLLWGWTNESDNVHVYVARGWAGVQTVPRKILLDSNMK